MVCELRGCCYMPGYGCYHSLPARQRYLVTDNINNEWRTNSDLKPAYSVTPLETDAVNNLRLNVQQFTSNIAHVVLYDPERYQPPVNVAFDSDNEVLIIFVCAYLLKTTINIADIVFLSIIELSVN